MKVQLTDWIVAVIEMETTEYFECANLMIQQLLKPVRTDIECFLNHQLYHLLNTSSGAGCLKRSEKLVNKKGVNKFSYLYLSTVLWIAMCMSWL